ncbi:hypothetical protein PITC_051580 [Penicillium italicum]|uniref:Uncharacterized protein n=1 Tax=Penicillium italicum TaxID=40296 RepID=A0A0A2KUL4_PENIT|nr:hypothetical protein PITC_051580 [Penicillium italicum]
MGQDSVFIMRSDYLPGFDDELWVLVDTQLSEDPDNEEANWVTVMIPEEMNETHSDEEIVEYALDHIRTRQAIVSEVALHNTEVSCISIPVPMDIVGTIGILTRAENDLKNWLEYITNGMVSLNREVIFGRQ